MTAARANAPTLAWLLTALTCLLAGMAIVESRHQAVALTIWAPVDAGETVEVIGRPTATPEPMRAAERPVESSSTVLFEADLADLPAGPALLTVARHIVPPDVELTFEAVFGPTVLLVESGTLSIQRDSVDVVALELNASPPAIVLSEGERLVIAAGTRYAVRNIGSTAAIALLVTIAPDPQSAAD